MKVFHINAFTSTLFTGNPAAVCVLDKWLPDDVLFSIARENNLPVTAFILKQRECFEIRWMTPELEIDICGHGTLSAAYVVFQHLANTLEKVTFKSKIELLEVNRRGDDIILNFPEKLIEACHYDFLETALGVKPVATYSHKNERVMVVLPTEASVRNLKPDMSILKLVTQRGITVTAAGSEADFVSRTFYPKNELVKEDAVTGAAHCLLVPYWSHQFNKTRLSARQLSRRGGEIQCEYAGDRVLLAGKAVLYKEGEVLL